MTRSFTGPTDLESALAILLDGAARILVAKDLTEVTVTATVSERIVVVAPSSFAATLKAALPSNPDRDEDVAE